MSPKEQLRVLEDTYAECMIIEADTRTLSALWNQIKGLRQQSGLPIHYESQSERNREKNDPSQGYSTTLAKG